MPILPPKKGVKCPRWLHTFGLSSSNSKYRKREVLDKLHGRHPGIVRMKRLARSTVWWPEINKEIERKVKSCQQCKYNEKSLAAIQMHTWE